MEKIVIIEDDPGIRTVLRLALKSAGFADVVAEERGDAGLQTVLRERPALVVRPCDPRLVESAVANLVQNAIRHSGSKTVEVRVGSLPNGKASIRVADRGVGIPAECQSRLFERFYRVDKNRSPGGSGSPSSSTSISSTAAKCRCRRRPAKVPRSRFAFERQNEYVTVKPAACDRARWAA